MKKIFLTTVLMLAWGFSARATLCNWSSGSLNTLIPDNSSAGYTFSAPAGGGAWDSNPTGGNIDSVDVSLNLSGGYNGDLYGYLVYTVGGNSTTAILLNRVGRSGANDAGSSIAGMNVTLSGTTGSDIHTAIGPLSGTYLADGRTASPTGDFTGVTPTAGAGLDAFNSSSLAAGGTWTLFLADLSAGDQSQLLSWGLGVNVSVVPEPVTWALLLFCALMALVGLARWHKAQQS